MGGYLVYGAAASGSVPVEAALTLLGVPYEVVERPTWEKAAADAIEEINPLRQVPALVTPEGELITESAAILIWLADRHPQSGLSPAPDAPERARFLRWMSYISAQIYGLYWIRDAPSRLADGDAAQAQITQRTAARIIDCWRMMEAQLAPGRYLLGDTLTVLDLYACVVSRFGPRRRAVAKVAPCIAEVLARVDADPRLTAFWAARYPFEKGWDVPEA